nr:hypothetical protein [uncultured Desulfobacter sp.]
MNEKDIRWEQRFSNYQKALKTDLCLLHCIENQALIDHIQRVGIIFYTPDMID